MLHERSDESGSPHVPMKRYRQKMYMPVPLAPISEIRRVTFAAKYVQNEDDLSCSPVDVVGVRFIPSVSEYTESEKRNIWCTVEEIGAMKQRAFRDIDLRRSEIRFHARTYSCDIRGLERLVYNDSNICARMRYESLCALLEEQHRQRCWRYGVNNPGGSLVHHGEERIKEVAIAKGGSILSQQIAFQLAKQDEEEAEEYLERQTRRAPHNEEKEEDDRDDEEIMASFVAMQQQRQKQSPDIVLSPRMGRKFVEQQQGTSKSSPSASDESCCWCLGVAEKVGRSLLLHAILTPFLGIQRGDALCVE